MSQIALSDLNAASVDDFVAVLENVVEYSPWIAQAAVEQRPFAGINPAGAELPQILLGGVAVLP